MLQNDIVLCCLVLQSDIVLCFLCFQDTGELVSRSDYEFYQKYGSRKISLTMVCVCVRVCVCVIIIIDVIRNNVCI